MKVSDFVHRYPTTVGTRRDGICRVRLFVADPSMVIALLTDIGDINSGASVTNSIESVCRSLIGRGLVPADCQFIEHYHENSFRGSTFDLVTLGKDDAPSWKPIAPSEVEILLKCDSDELNSKIENNKQLLQEADRIRFEIDPHIDSPWPENHEKTLRRNQIELHMISKRNLAELVKNGATEQELQTLLKQDLSIFGEIYADPKEEYICFSEFPLENGRVDFVIFSGRSRMDITFIEIKGADFYLLNQGHYNKFSGKIEEATDQIRVRLRHAIEDIKGFRRRAHQIRMQVENGGSAHNSLMGPEGRLEVDPDKDINIRCVVIGGRTKDDVEESKKRHDFERSTHPSIRIESWDTWLRKLRRE
ncbi:Shedu immune nuclease family protein [Burkholderia sola]|uniref:Shedu immune nuclease family protein n=1 Tax=Burkholderia sola TaxID=2843302 RepID=UPI001C0A85A2|nr:hypothetical protein BCCR75389_00004 [Burkholderia cenocepacia]CAG2258211.1 hypothetical protein BCCR75386_00004 [Burkholderia cenocepacia]CAG2258230.1 hypothetical protein BCCR75388_00004 [Burkholderia cenocepacia]CAG2258286.1 hypothetical protein BCCR75387_00004 [Burkholderia cenocepacia]CAG2258294.1 hypothetical protein BCCR75384_00004 [Burkholderia cenocepacia]